jgi:hypothetical protein
VSEAAFFVVGFSLMLIASRVTYVWRKRTIARRRRLGGVMLILAPLYSFIAFTIAAGMSNIVYPLNLLPPAVNTGNLETYLELACMVALLFTPFWSFGALCGYMLRSLIDRPLRL